MTIDQQLAEWWLTNLETSARFDAPWVAAQIMVSRLMPMAT